MVIEEEGEVGDGPNEAQLGSIIVKEASELKIGIGAKHDGDDEEDPNHLGIRLGWVV